MDIKIIGHANGDLQKFLEVNSNKYDVLLLTNHNLKQIPDVSKAKNHLHLIFDDITHHIPDYSGPYIKPTHEHVKAVLDWAKDKNDIICSCHAGISRSSASAYLIGVQSVGIDESLKFLTPGKHQPNPLMVKMGSEILNDNKIWTRFTQWFNDSLNQFANEISCL